MKEDSTEMISPIDIKEDVRFIIETPENPKKLNEHPRRLISGAIILILEGYATISINITDYEIRKNELITILPGTIVQFTRKSPDFSSFYVAFSSTFLYRNFLKRPESVAFSLINQQPILSQKELECTLLYDFLTLLQNVYRREKEKPDSFVIKCLTVSTMHEVYDTYRSLYESVETKPGSRQNAIYKKLVALITKHYREERSIAFYADQLFLTPKYLSAVILRASGGRRIPDLINRAVIMDAKSQLKSTDLTVQQISGVLNFPDSSIFGKYFKKHTGMTPLQYRNSD